MKKDELDVLLERCRKIDFSDASREEVLARLNFEGDVNMKQAKNFKKSVALIAAVAAVLALSAMVVAAGPVWRAIWGGEYVEELFLYEGEDFTGIGITLDPAAFDSDTPIVIEVDGREVVVMDTHRFYDVDEALSHLTLDTALLPTWLPEGFVFEHAFFPVSPVRNPDDIMASKMLMIQYGNGYTELLVRLSYNSAEWGIPIWSADQEEIEINGNHAAFGNKMLGVQIGDTLHIIDAPNLERDEFIRIAESLQ
jgi:hypothetical protein